METPSTLVGFAERYRVRVQRDDCGEQLICGKFGHIYQHAAGLLGLVLEEPRSGKSKRRSLLARRRKAFAAGLSLHQLGQVEAILLFDVGCPSQANLAVRLVGAKRRRVPSPAQLEILRRAREAPRFCKIPAQRPLQPARRHDSHGGGRYTMPSPVGQYFLERKAVMRPNNSELARRSKL
jgi:hypothetical protein